MSDFDDEADDAPAKRKPGRPRKNPLPPAQTTTVQPTAFTVAPPIAVDAITVEADRFHCRPYACVLMASACVRRQDMLAKPRHERTGDYVECEGCKDGALVRVRLQMAPAGPSAGKAPHGPSPSRTGALPLPRPKRGPPPKEEPAPEMPKPGPMLLRKSETWQRAEPSLPPPLSEIPDLPPPAPRMGTIRSMEPIVFDEAAAFTPEMVDGVTPVLGSDVGVHLASTPQVPAGAPGFTAARAPEAPPARVRRVGTAGWSGKGQPRAEPVAVTEAQVRLTHIEEVYADIERRTLGLLEAIRATRAKLAAER